MRNILKILGAAALGLAIVVLFVLGVSDGVGQASAEVREIARVAYRNIVPPERVRRTNALNRANAEREVERALARNDYRLVGIGGIGLFFPGLEERDPAVQRAVSRFGYRFIDGTSDYAENAEQARFQTAAYDYARRYNLYIWPRLPK